MTNQLDNLVTFDSIKELKKEKEKVTEAEIEMALAEAWTNFTQNFNIPEEVLSQLLSEEELFDAVTDLDIVNNCEYVFHSYEIALVMGKFLLTLDINEDVSHYDIVSSVSRLSNFYRLVPVKKSDKRLVFTDDSINITLQYFHIRDQIRQYLTKDEDSDKI